MTISEVSKKFGLTVDTLRYYEKVGLIDPVNKNSRGIRDYGQRDIGRIQFIKCMRNAGLTIEVLVKYIKLYNEGDETVEERKAILIDQRKIVEDKMSEMKETLDRLNHKIEVYDDVLLQKEKELLGRVTID